MKGERRVGVMERGDGEMERGDGEMERGDGEMGDRQTQGETNRERRVINEMEETKSVLQFYTDRQTQSMCMSCYLAINTYTIPRKLIQATNYYEVPHHQVWQKLPCQSGSRVIPRDA